MGISQKGVARGKTRKKGQKGDLSESISSSPVGKMKNRSKKTRNRPKMVEKGWILYPHVESLIRVTSPPALQWEKGQKGGQKGVKTRFHREIVREKVVFRPDDPKKVFPARISQKKIDSPINLIKKVKKMLNSPENPLKD